MCGPRLIYVINVDDLPELSLEDTKAARDELLDLRGQYLLRNMVVESVLTANPILKAVHNSTDASPPERYVTHISLSLARRQREVADIV